MQPGKHRHNKHVLLTIEIDDRKIIHLYWDFVSWCIGTLLLSGHRGLFSWPQLLPAEMSPGQKNKAQNTSGTKVWFAFYAFLNSRVEKEVR